MRRYDWETFLKEKRKLANLVSDVSIAYKDKKKSVIKADIVGPDDAFECQAIPSTSRSLPMRSCNKKIKTYEEKSSSDDEHEDWMSQWILIIIVVLPHLTLII